MKVLNFISILSAKPGEFAVQLIFDLPKGDHLMSNFVSLLNKIKCNNWNKRLVNIYQQL